MSPYLRNWLIVAGVIAFLAALLLPAMRPARESNHSHRQITQAPGATAGSPSSALPPPDQPISREHRVPLLACPAVFSADSPPASQPDAWSPAVLGLQARLSIDEKPKLHGVRWLVPYLELRNVSDRGDAMHVPCGEPHLRVELVDEHGQVVRSGIALSRSGPFPDLGTLILPHDSSLRVSLECRNWGIPKDAAAMVSTDSGAWTLSDKDRGQLYLRATLTAENSDPNSHTWHGEIRTPLVRVDWE